MFSDFLTFITELPSQLTQTGTFLPDSFETGAAHLSNLSHYISNIDTTYKIIGTIVSLVIALFGCFFGYKLSRFFMSLTGFLTGAIAGGMLGVHFFDLSGGAALLCVLGGAMVLSLMAYKIYQAGIFILCFALAFMAGASLLPFTGDIQFFLSVVAGFIVGMLALKFIRPVIILTSALVCGSSAAGLLLTASTYMDVPFLSRLSAYPVILTAGLCLLGMLVQFLTTSAPGKH